MTATLNHLVDLAYHNNLSLQAAAVHILQAQAQLKVAIGELFPQQQVLAGEVQHQRQAQSTLLAPGLNPLLDTSQLGVSASWELDFWGKYRRGIEADRAAMLASVAAYDSALVSLTAGVASTYLNIRTFQQRIQVAKDNLDTQKESLRIARAQFEAGGAPANWTCSRRSRSWRGRRHRFRASRTHCARARTRWPCAVSSRGREFSVPASAPAA